MLVSCPKCGCKFELAPDLCGVNVRCFNCNVKFQFFEDGKIEVLEDFEASADSSVDEVDDAVGTEGVSSESTGQVEDEDFFDRQAKNFFNVFSNAKKDSFDAYVFFGAAVVFIVCMIILVGMLIFRTNINSYYAEKDKAAYDKINRTACQQNLKLTGSLFLKYAGDNGNKLPTGVDYRDVLDCSENDRENSLHCIEYGLYEVNKKVVSLDLITNKSKTPLVRCTGHKLAFFADGKLDEYEEGGK